MAGADVFGKVIKYGFGAWNVIDPYMQYRDQRKKGKGALSSIGKIGLSTALYASPLGTPLFIKDVVQGGIQGANAIGQINSGVSYKAHRANFGGNFEISNNGATMRQRGANAIQKAGITGRNALGCEAKSFYSRVSPY